MLKGITHFIFFISVMLCTAHAINISGVVKNSSGSVVEGALVRLGKGAISTTTGPDGSFILTDNVTGNKHPARSCESGNDCPFRIDENAIRFSGTAQTEVRAAMYDCNGRLLLLRCQEVSAGESSIPLPHLTNGIHLCRISTHNTGYTFKRVTGMTTDSKPISSGGSISSATQARTASMIDDALLCTKEGYQLSRIVVSNSDTSGIQMTIIPLITGTVTDIEGNVYQTVRIGKQEWTTENLRTTKYSDGTSISQGSASGAAYWFYTNVTDAAAKKKWGALYNFAAVKTGKLAPAGWHVPTDAEWDTLQNYLIVNGYNDDGTTSENRIAKAIAAKKDWQVYNEPGAISRDMNQNNASGFTALPAGYRYYDGTFSEQGVMAYWWSATAYDASYAWYRNLWAVNFNLDRGYRVTMLGCSVRLVRNN